ncbi:hypothetical protein [Bradyrhizobium sp. ARR65]|uniref:hypothetical protein n=1 Tax=Bradyrhizobium sp. ARR65 TaxID=1040989 RepID=UPI000A7C4845|nr:hypothetical protein [Bradyrhizobium sp. ARR65]
MRPVPDRRLWLLVLGFSVWGSALGFVYVLHSVGCAFAWPANAIRLGLGLVLFVHLALVGLLWRSYAGTYPGAPAVDPTDSFLNWVILWTLIAAFVTIVFTLGPTLLLTTCT